MLPLMPTVVAAILTGALITWPVPAPMERGFERPPASWAPGHRGLDFSAVPGTLVRSPRAGVVAFVGVVADKPVVSVRHGHVRSTFEPVTSTRHIGEVVQAGDAVGVVARGESHCNERCLHWGLKQGSQYLDPRLLLARSARLIPLRDVPTQ